MRILLAGASGFIGQHVLRALLDAGHEVVCTARRAQTSTDPRVRYLQADFANDTEQSVWLARLTGIEAVINTVGIFRASGTNTFERLHTLAPRALFAACAAAPQVRLVLQLSALGADAQADTPYHLSKKAADDYLAALPVPSAILQPSLVYGPEGASARLFKTLASMPLGVRFGKAPQLVQPVHIDDVVAAILALLRLPPASGSRRLPLVGPEALSFTAYLERLRSAMGMPRRPVLTLPGALSRLLAQAGGRLPGALLDADALRMLDRGNTGDPGPLVQLLGRPLTPIAAFITDPRAERRLAKLDWLLPVLRWSIVLVWIATAIVSFGLYPVAQSYELLARTGIPPELQPLMLYGAATFDLLLGLGIAFLPRRRWLWRAQLALIGFYTVVIAIKLPEFLLHPYGPLTKNLPMLASIWLLYELEE